MFLRRQHHRTPLLLAVVSEDLNQVQTLLANGADPNGGKKPGRTPLHAAAAGGRVDLAAALLDAGADPNACDASDTTPLHHAAFGGRPELIKLLLANGARPSPTNSQGQTPLALAARIGHLEAMEALLEGGANSDECLRPTTKARYLPNLAKPAIVLLTRHERASKLATALPNAMDENVKRAPKPRM